MRDNHKKKILNLLYRCQSDPELFNLVNLVIKHLKITNVAFPANFGRRSLT
ncbi:uncharacterized protein J3R85_020703 [Psidium guajava]|nr:uncharacterized protein J3R85_020703 [Psidium guajava]